jgi:hypothetical protein
MPRLDLCFMNKVSTPRRIYDLHDDEPDNESDNVTDDVPDERTKNKFIRHVSNKNFSNKYQASRRIEVRFDSPIHQKPSMRTQVFDQSTSDYLKWSINSPHKSSVYK